MQLLLSSEHFSRRHHKEGKYCEFKVSTIDEHYTAKYEYCPCQNGGTCDERVETNNKCVCPEGYSGFFCEFDETAPTCDLDCQNGGYCIFTTSKDGSGSKQKCHCPLGFTGTECDFEGQACGDAVCFNGSSCVTETVLGEIEAHHCDCRTATSDDGKRFAGMHCQYEETASCNTEENIEARLFCVNDGECKTNGKLGCECPHGYTGFSCEFYVGDNIRGRQDDSKKPIIDDVPVDEVPECTLDCSGHGVCTYGMKDTSALGRASEASGLSQTHDNLQHCVCEEGFTGIYCDRKIDICRRDGLFCLHGAKCVIDSSGTPYCDCTLAHGDGTEQYYGTNCESLVTSVCTLGNAVEDLNPRAAFCVNDGTCKRTVDKIEEYVLRYITKVPSVKLMPDFLTYNLQTSWL